MEEQQKKKNWFLDLWVDDKNRQFMVELALSYNKITNPLEHLE